MLKAAQIALFVPNPPKADEIARICFPGVEIVSSMTQPQGSNANLSGELERQVASSPVMGRIDFTWEVKASPPAFPDGNLELAHLTGDFAGVDRFADTLPVARVACVLTSRARVDSPQAALAIGRQQIPGVEIPRDATELIYRTNVPRDVSGYRLNRLAQWQASAVWFVGIVNGQPSQVQHHVWESTFDVNTAAERQLNQGEASRALDIVRGEARRLLETGFAGL
ncbi:hypothetical protein [Sphingobium agri]|uniref:Uncharacterized protein n=1 Tax=Sphingobium agri TaxID=2933566 RepID=A0ABT0E290_9SPHN|nr:hypothetical protein [Sphingobium agri]MCK0533433.1 hypothetical protein [Sphingobium agri]